MSISYNSDTNIVNQIKRKLKDNNGYCPCSIIKNKDTKCICKEFKEMDNGTCHCGLYVKNNV